jgi:hypothetical protein
MHFVTLWVTKCIEGATKWRGDKVHSGAAEAHLSAEAVFRLRKPPRAALA